MLTDSPPGPWTGLAEVLAGAVLFPSLFVAASAAWRRRGADGGGAAKTPSLSPGAALDCACKSVSAAFAVFSVYVGASVLSSCQDCDVVRDRRPLIRHFLCFGLTYFLYDIWAMFVVFRQGHQDNQHCQHGKEKSEGKLIRDFLHAKTLLVVHHLVVPTLGFPFFMWYRPDLGDCLLGAGLLMEASTPFVSARAILANLDLKSSPIYLLNGVVMLVVFFACRILIFPFLYLLYANQIGQSLLDTTLHSVPITCNLSMILALAPQAYWFALMLRGSYRTIRQLAKEKAS